jgi:glutathione gamma-glutamylcysteinyltransferase
VTCQDALTSFAMKTLYRRPLPGELIAFSSTEGRAVFREALAAGGMDGYFPLAEQFHTQADPAFCGLGSLVVALNALGIDPGRLWKGPWRWFAEDLLDCCLPLERVRERGITLDELACLARCNGATVALTRASNVGLDAWRHALQSAASASTVLVVAYDRQTLGQTGSGHFSPIGGYHAARDLALVLDVARFKYPPHWTTAELLYRAMLPHDSATGRSRGWLSLRASAEESMLGFTVRCSGESWLEVCRRLDAVGAQLPAAANLQELAQRVAELAQNVDLRSPSTPAHAEALERTRAALRSSPAFPCVTSATPEVVVLLLWVLADRLTPVQRAWLGAEPAVLRGELEHVRAQFEAIVTSQT